MKKLKYLFILFIPQLWANHLFMPLPNDTAANLSLVKWRPTPSPIQYHGFIEYDGYKRCVFLVDGNIIYLKLNETVQQRYTLKQIRLSGNQVVVEDAYTKQWYILNSGEVSYISDQFECVLFDKMTQQTLTFSDIHNRYKMDDVEILISPQDTHLYVWDMRKNKEPLLYTIPISELK